MTTARIENRIRWSGLLIGFGLAIQMPTLLWTHPLSFMVFLLVGCPLVGIGMLVYLYSLVSHIGDETK
jgi:uncharacterized membrane protein YczE